MIISSKSWHYKLFLFNYQLLERFKGRSYWYESEPNRINLCPYMRTILIWGPMLYLFYGLLWFLMGLTFLYIPFLMIGVSDTGWLGSVILSLVITAGIIGGLIAGLTYTSMFVGKKIKEIKEEYEIRNADKPNGFFKILAAYWKSFHDKTCFTMDVK